MVEKIRFCMPATSEGVDIHARPMAAHAARKENAVYFLLDLKDHGNPEVFANSCMAFADIGDMEYVSRSESGEISNDRAKIEELWSVAYKAFRESPDDPNIRVLKVTPRSACSTGVAVQLQPACKVRPCLDSRKPARKGRLSATDWKSGRLLRTSWQSDACPCGG